MIYVTDTLRISKVDDKCLQLEILKEVESKETGEKRNEWKWCGYYGSLKDALIGALKKQLFNTTDENLNIQEVISRIDLAEANILKAIR